MVTNMGSSCVAIFVVIVVALLSLILVFLSLLAGVVFRPTVTIHAVLRIVSEELLPRVGGQVVVVDKVSHDPVGMETEATGDEFRNLLVVGF